MISYSICLTKVLVVFTLLSVGDGGKRVSIYYSCLIDPKAEADEILALLVIVECVFTRGVLCHFSLAFTGELLLAVYKV